MPRRNAATDQEPVQDRIVSYAQTMFFSCGFSTVTMDHLAVDLGISKKTLYKHFGSKEALLNEILERRMTLIESDLTELTSVEAPEFATKLQNLITYAVQKFAEIKEPFVVDLRRNAPQVLRKIEEFRERVIPKFCGAIVSEGLDRGKFRSDFDADVVVQILLHSAQGILLGGRPLRSDLSEKTAIDTIVRVVLQGIEIRN